MIRHAFAIAAFPVFAALAAPASAQSVCDRPASQLTAAQLETCRADSIVVIRPRIEIHRDTGVTVLRGQ
jgi:hypothetical protein